MLGLIRDLCKKIKNLYKIFVDRQNVHLSACAFQLNFNGINFNANADSIFTATQTELDRIVPREKQVFALQNIMAPTFPPFRQIDLQAMNLVFGYIAGGLKINQTIAWCGINHMDGEAMIPQYVNSFFDFFRNNVCTQSSIQNIIRIGFIKTYITNDNNIRLQQLLQGFETQNTILERRIAINDNEYVINLVIQKIGSQYKIDCDVSIQQILSNEQTVVRIQELLDNSLNGGVLHIYNLAVNGQNTNT